MRDVEPHARCWQRAETPPHVLTHVPLCPSPAPSYEQGNRPGGGVPWHHTEVLAKGLPRTLDSAPARLHSDSQGPEALCRVEKPALNIGPARNWS